MVSSGVDQGLHQGFHAHSPELTQFVWHQSNPGRYCSLLMQKKGMVLTLFTSSDSKGAPGLTTRNKKLLGAPGMATRSKDATRGSWPYY